MPHASSINMDPRLPALVIALIFGSTGCLPGDPQGASAVGTILGPGTGVTSGSNSCDVGASSQSLDESFGDGGLAVSAFDLDFVEAYAVEVLPDGKILAAGAARRLPDEFAFGLFRLTADGALDPSFGQGGGVVTDLGIHYDFARSVAVQNDGKIVLAGIANDDQNLNGDSDIAVVRYLPTGELDTGFGTDGVVITDLGLDDWGTRVTVRPDGKILVAGASVQGGQTDFTVARYLPSGTLDVEFGESGIARASFGGYAAHLYAGEAADAVLQPDGKILVVGSAFRGIGDGGPTNQWAMVRFLPWGSLDPSFGENGRVLSAIGHEARGVALQSDGKIVVAGRGASAILARFAPDGSMDEGFGENGWVEHALRGDIDPYAPTNDTGFAWDVAVEPGGAIVVGGHSHYSGYEFGLAWFTADGELDTTKGCGGYAWAGQESLRGFGLALDSAGRAYLGGYFELEGNPGPGGVSLAVARFAP